MSLHSDSDELLARVWDYLEAHHQAALATTGRAGCPDAGLPHAATVFYALDSRMRLVFLSKATSRHAEHIAAGSPVAATVAGIYDDWRRIQGVQLWGRARVARGVARVSALAVYHHRFPFVQALLSEPRLATRLSDVAVFRFEPERVAFTDNQEGPFGRRLLELSSSTRRRPTMAAEGAPADEAAPAEEQPPALGGSLVGRVVSGRSEAAGFIQLPWVREQLARLLGQPPYPGTLNLRLVRPEYLASWASLRATGACLAVPPGEPGFCPASFYPVKVNRTVPAGVILPHIPEYPDDVIEVVAADSLRGRFGLADDDPVELTW